MTSRGQKKNTVKKIYPLVGKKKFNFFGLIVRKSFSNSKCLLTNIQDIVIEVKKYKKIRVQGGIFS